MGVHRNNTTMRLFMHTLNRVLPRDVALTLDSETWAERYFPKYFGDTYLKIYREASHDCMWGLISTLEKLFDDDIHCVSTEYVWGHQYFPTYWDYDDN